ncbi:YIP1 family protein [Paenibacillus anaericanus]|uniref:YIP1 family protein n=1 Tax=Paenibacillus anaericanus TaxID=170367 RepID=A0A3S1BLV4_9BACL|nr:Yip1 family protein [Paenibacillus anaericanus]RUT44463.1 YIP1 family protein [Paenibacillus anaericanus]
MELLKDEQRLHDANGSNGNDRWNIWLKIWIRPRETMRRILNEPNNVDQVIVLLLVGGFIYGLNQSVLKNSGDSTSLWSLLLSLTFATIIGAIIYYFVIGGLFYWVGKLLGGTGSYRDVRLSLAYAYIPSVITLVTWIPSLILFGKENFTSETPRMDSSIGLLIIFLIFGIIEFIIGIWSVFIFLKCLGEAHRFSAWKALLTFILPFILLVILGGIIAVALGG